MRITGLYFICWALSAVSVTAQPPNLTPHIFGGAQYDILVSVDETADGMLIVCGYTSSSGAGQIDCYLAKVDLQGVVQWSRTLGGVRWDEAKRVKRVSDGGFIFVGASNLSNQNRFDMYAIRMNQNGDTTWTRLYGGEENEACEAVVEAADGGFFLGGFTISFGQGQADMYLVRIDANGDTLWTRTFGGEENDYCMSMERTADGGLILAGSAFSFNSANRDIYLVKTDSLGNLQWQRCIEIAHPNYCNSIKTLDDGGFILCGTTHLYDDSEVSDIFLLRLDSSGDTLWTRTYGGESWDEGKAVFPSFDGGFLVAGSCISPRTRSDDAFIMKTDSLGGVLWTQVFGDEGWEAVNDVIELSNGDIAGVGYTSSLEAQLSDFCVLILSTSQGVIGIPAEFTIAAVYPNPFNPSITVIVGLPQTGRLYLEIFNISGQRVAELANGEYLQGYHNFTFDGGGLSSGIYFLRARIPGKMNQLRKVILLR